MRAIEGPACPRESFYFLNCDSIALRLYLDIFDSYNMNTTLLTKLIQRLRKGVASKEEKQLLDEFWEEAVRDTSVIDAMPETERKALKHEILTAVQDKIKQASASRRTRRVWIWSAAASIVALGLVVALVLGNLRKQRVIETAYGERRQVTLPDNSEVILNGNSRLSYYPGQNGRPAREVWVEGEMFFNVQHTTDGRKFVVHISDSVVVEVLGTAFNVKNRGENVQVMLVSGAIELHVPGSQKDETYVLAPGELAAIANKKAHFRPVKEQRLYTSWTADTLVFDNTPLHDVSLMLKEVYGVNVAFSTESLRERKLTGKIYSASVDDILYALAQTFDLVIAHKGDSVHVSNRDVSM